MKNYYTHRGVNQPPYIKGFPMSLALIFLGIMLIVIFIVLALAMSIGNFNIGVVLFIVLVCSIGFYLYKFVVKIGAFGIQKKIYVRYFYRIDKFYGGRPKIYKIKI